MMSKSYVATADPVHAFWMVTPTSRAIEPKRVASACTVKAVYVVLQRQAMSWPLLCPHPYTLQSGYSIAHTMHSPGATGTPSCHRVAGTRSQKLVNVTEVKLPARADSESV